MRLTGTGHHRHRAISVGIGLAVLLGVGSIVYKTVLSPSPPDDFHVFYYSAENSIQGQPFVGDAGATTARGTQPYGYFPLTIFYFYPFTLLTVEIAYIIHSAVQIASAIGLGVVTHRVLRSHGIEVGLHEFALLIALFLLSMVAVENIRIGQINHSMLLLMTIGYWLIVSDRSETLAGVCFGLVALFKLWPVIFGVWLLRHRAYRAVGAALAAGFGGIGTSLLVFGIDVHQTYFQWILTTRSRTSEFAGGIPPDRGLLTIRRAISTALPTLDPVFMAVIAVFLVGVPVSYVLLSPAATPLETFTAILAGFLLAFPSIQHYMLYPLVPIILFAYTVESDRTRFLLVVCLIAVSWVATAQNIVDIAAVLAPESVLTALSSILNSIFSVMHPATAGLVLLLGFVVYQLDPNPIDYSRRMRAEWKAR